MSHNKLIFAVGAAATLVASLFLAGRPALADSGEEQVPVGPRPLALGGAYTALAEGPDALTWNPAGLALQRVSHLRATTSNLHGLGIRDNVIAVSSPIWEGLGFGLEWYHSGFSEAGLTDGLHRLSLGAGWRPLRKVSVGASAKWRQYTQSYQDVDQGTGSGLGLDLGVLAALHPRLTLGVAWRDAGGSTLHYDDGSSSRPYDGILAAGAVVRPLRSARALLLSADLDRDAHLGAEVQLLELLALRAGWTRDLDGLDGARLSMGFGLRYGPATASYSFQSHPMLDATHTFGMAVDFTLSPKLVEIQGASLDPLFASFYKSYATQPGGEVVLSNITDEPVEVRVSVMQRQLMDEPSERTLYLRPGVAQRVDLTLGLSPRVIELREGRPVPFNVEVSYLSAGRRRSDNRKVQTFVYEPGVLNWGDGVDRAAAFITPSHEMVAEFTRSIVRATAGQDRGLLNRTTTLAARLFDGLAACGITYTPDPLNPYGALREKPFAVDNIQYPAELLVSRTGDCDDSSVLYASMLENVGIRTALVDVPEHIYVMFDTGIYAREREATGLDPALFVERDGSLWIPVETTALGAPFHQAWRKGADLYRRWEGTADLRVVDVLQARSHWEAAVYAARVPKGTAAPAVDAAVVQHAVTADLAQLDAWRESHLQQTYLAKLDTDAPSVEAVKLARVFYLNRDYVRAHAELNGVPEAQRDAALWNNLGNTQLAEGDAPGAMASYDRARALDQGDAGVALNRGLALHLIGRTEEARQELAQAVHQAGSVPAALQLLGIKPEATAPSGGRAGEAVTVEQLSLRRVEELLQAAISSVPAPIPVKPDSGALAATTPDSTVAQLPTPAAGDSLAVGQGAPGAEAPGDSARTTRQDSTGAGSSARPTYSTLPAGSRGAEIGIEALHDLLYWKPSGPNG